MSTADVQQLNEKVERLTQVVEGVAETQDNMLQLLQGNPLDSNDKGMLGRVSKVEGLANEHEKYKNRAVWTFGGFLFAGGVIYSGLQLIIQHFLK